MSASSTTRARSDAPDGVSGRRLVITANPSNAVFNLQGVLGGGMVNEFKVGYNAAPSTIGASTTAGFENFNLNLSGSVANSGIAGQGAIVRAHHPGRPRSGQQRGERARRARTIRTR